MRISPYAALPALVGALLVAGFGSRGSAGSSSTADGRSTTSVTPSSPISTTSGPAPTIKPTFETPPPPGDPTDPPLQSPKPPTITATGRVSVSDVEKACTVMQIDGQTYQLVGDGVGALRSGTTVTLTGYPDKTLSTTCQVGIVLRVTSLTNLTR